MTTAKEPEHTATGSDRRPHRATASRAPGMGSPRSVTSSATRAVTARSTSSGVMPSQGNRSHQ